LPSEPTVSHDDYIFGMCINVVYGIFMTFITSPSGPVVYETLEAAGVIGTLNDGGLVKAVLVGGILGDWTRPVPLRTTRK